MLALRVVDVIPTNDTNSVAPDLTKVSLPCCTSVRSLNLVAVPIPPIPIKSSPTVKSVTIFLLVGRLAFAIQNWSLEFRLSYAKRPSRAELIRDLAKL